MLIIIFRTLFILTSIFFSVLFYAGHSIQAMLIAGGAAAVISLAVIIVIEFMSHSFQPRHILAAIFGLLFGLGIGHLLVSGVDSFNLEIMQRYAGIIRPLIYHISGFAAMMFFLINNEDISFLDKIVPVRESDADVQIPYKILDTSVIIDGRIADICDTGFLEGILVIPNFVLNELQMIADSADSIKRNRGRRGLDILNKMQKDQSIMVKISDMDFKDIPEVDSKLVQLAKVMKAKVITNDFNLNKVAEFHGVDVLNINELSNALKPIVLPGEEMRVLLLKEGKDSNQAIGYLDDGTMVVVENGRRRINDEVEVTVTSVLQTTAGRMIFTRLKED
ncbi:MAG TPA: TRAM domain-containing protein [Spirochaetota bacterium]|nr:TRAM domain-containing protein [Spirochaetota bacterium]HPF05577.1 TRAM domain-containing protein [Spirochaetota bacterium]HPJ41540.1 TRAM domain-containing protein [Spirochaetota bacterium]HPR36902.1 TRAM domain-containing protein [Spirochaetota bacterium]HRX47400.1 TRAM domain-containing protein [Spirochaetota bacterium]